MYGDLRDTMSMNNVFKDTCPDYVFHTRQNLKSIRGGSLKFPLEKLCWAFSITGTIALVMEKISYNVHKGGGDDVKSN